MIALTRFQPCVSLSIALFVLGACKSSAENSDAPLLSQANLAGTWRAVLDSAGGELPFTIEIFSDEKPGPDGAVAIVRNGTETATFSELSIVDRRVTFRLAPFDTAITAILDPTGKRLSGTWQLMTAEGLESLPFRAQKDNRKRFSRPGRSNPDADAVPSVAGSWTLQLRSDGNPFPGLMELTESDDTVQGTLLYPEGTLRYLVGQYSDGFLQLSTFAGGIVVLIRGRARKDGTLKGDIWFNQHGALRFTAESTEDENLLDTLPDPYKVVTSVNPDKELRFSFPNTEGKMVSLANTRYEGKVVLIELFGSWCINCNDAAKHLSEWYKQYKSRGLEVIGLAYEHTGDKQRDLRQVIAYRDRYQIQFPLLIAGTTDLDKPLEDLSQIQAYPTLIFVGRDGQVKKTHSGFFGPSAGQYYEKQIARLEADIEELLGD